MILLVIDDINTINAISITSFVFSILTEDIFQFLFNEIRSQLDIHIESSNIILI